MCSPNPGVSALSKSKRLQWPPGWSVPRPVSPSPSLTAPATPASRQLLECSELSPPSEHSHMPFPLPAMLFPHFPCGSRSASRSLPQRGLLGPFSKLSCISTTTSSSILPASWGPVLSPPSTHLHLEYLFTKYSGLTVPQMECQLLQGKDFCLPCLWLCPRDSPENLGPMRERRGVREGADSKTSKTEEAPGSHQAQTIFRNLLSLLPPF